MGAVATIKRALASVSSDPVTAAKARLEGAQREHEVEQARLGDADADLNRLKRAFEAEAADEIADQILAAQALWHRRRLFAERTSNKVRDAEKAVAAAIEAERQAKLAELDAQCDPQRVRDEIRAIWSARGQQALADLVAVLNDAKAITSKANRACREACKMRGIEGTQLSILLYSIPPASAALRGAARDTTSKSDRFDIGEILD